MSERETQPFSGSMIAKYRIGTVSRLTGLSADVVRVWERRYGAIKPQRSEGGSRLYSDSDIARLRKLRQAIEMGHAIGQVARLPDTELDLLSIKHRTDHLPEDPIDPFQNLRERFLDAILRMDVVSAEHEIHRAAMLYPPRIVIKNVIGPLLTEIGNRWGHRDFGIAQEHLATNLIRNLLASLFRLYPPDEAAETIVFATNVEERHEFGILIGALIAATRGWRVVYLGTEMPAPEIVRTAKLTKARVVVLSVVNSNARTGEELRTIAEQIPSYARVWIGGIEAPRYSELIERANWNLVHDFDDLDDRLKR